MRKKHYKLSYTKENTNFYEAEDGEVIALTTGFICKANTFEVDKKGNLSRSLCLNHSISSVRGYPGILTVYFKEEE